MLLRKRVEGSTSGSAEGAAGHVVCGEVAAIHAQIVLVGSAHRVVVHATVL